MTYTLTKAAEATGKSKSTIFRAIRSGKLTAARDPVSGDWMVEPAELHRLYPVVERDVANGTVETHHAPAPEIAALKREIEIKDELLGKEQRERAAAVDALERLCRQIEGERDNLREQNTRLTALLTDQRGQPKTAATNPATPPAPAKRRWRLFGGRG